MSQKDETVVENTDEVVEETTNDEQETTPTLEELNNELAEVQKEFKTLRDNNSSSEEIANKQRAIEKTRGKIEELKNPSAPKAEGYEFSIDDVHDMREAGFRADSEKAGIVKKFIDAGIVSDNVKEALADPAIQAKFSALDAKNNAIAVGDENDNDDYIINAKKDIETRYSASGEVPEDAQAQKDLATSNLEKMGL